MFNAINLTDLMPLFAASAAFFAVLVIWRLSMERHSPLAKKAKELLERENSLRHGFLGPTKRKSLFHGDHKTFITRIVTRLNLLRSSQAERMETRLAQAGWRSKEALVTYLFVKLCMPFVGAVMPPINSSFYKWNFLVI